jgi:hypothetical protein
MKRSGLIPHVKATAGAFAAASLAMLLFTSVPARADIQVRIDIGNAPPPPRIVFVAPPHERRYPGDPVYVVDDPRIGDYDCFHYQGYYWVFQDGYWYRSASWRGPFAVYDPRYVPTVFYRQPPQRWKHHPSGPPVFTNRGGGGTTGLMQKAAGRVQQPASRSVVRAPQPARESGPPPQVTHRQGGGGSPPVVGKGDGGPPGHAKKSAGPPGKAKKGGGEPSGHDKKDAKGNDKGGGHGGN